MTKHVCGYRSRNGIVCDKDATVKDNGVALCALHALEKAKADGFVVRRNAARAT